MTQPMERAERRIWNAPRTTTIKAAILGRTMLLVGLCWLRTGEAQAHVGPPYPILVDEPVAGYRVSLWGDPDLGVGTFYILIDAEAGAKLQPDLDGLEIALSVQPVSGRLPQVAYPATRDPQAPRVQYVARPTFDRREMWKVTLVIHRDRAAHELVAEVEATPDALGPWSVLIFLVPFAALGGVWLLALHRRAELAASLAGRGESVQSFSVPTPHPGGSESVPQLRRASRAKAL